MPWPPALTCPAPVHAPLPTPDVELVQALARHGVPVVAGRAAALRSWGLSWTDPDPVMDQAPTWEDALLAAHDHAQDRIRTARVRTFGQSALGLDLGHWTTQTESPDTAVAAWAAHLHALADRAAFLRRHNEPWGGGCSLFAEPVQEASVDDAREVLRQMGVADTVSGLVQRDATVCLLADHADLMICDLYGQMVLRAGGETRVLPGPGYALLTSAPVSLDTLLHTPDAQWDRRGTEARARTWQVMRGHWPEWSVPGWWVAAPCAHSDALVFHAADPYGPFLRCTAPPGGWAALELPRPLPRSPE
ncbi:hypothetical protein [Deinococcus ficus]|uniref:hypothetical protein n=1 Tax=Deinococcus ficus TaxID=317577 RepID=UPI0004872676|nr:hypothetical protein [Deinococcus ficus]